jgi:hypothetical protein
MPDSPTRSTTNAIGTTVSPAVGGDSAAAKGKVTATKDGVVLFAPAGTNYELHLVAPNYAGPVGTMARGVIRATARKVWTVPSGGNFIAPIFGSPRIIQGRVRALDGKSLLVQAGAPIVVDLPDDPDGIDMANGPIRVGAMVNVTAMPGARFEPGAS